MKRLITLALVAALPLAGAALAGETPSAKATVAKSAAELTGKPGRATAHDGTSIYFETFGNGPRALFLGPASASAKIDNAPPGLEDYFRAQKQGFIDEFAQGYKIILIDYPGEPKLYTLTPAAVARDYLAIADAAGVDKFSYYGFSWGCVTGLQLALRTDRVEALACGGFPALNGPYAEMLKLTRMMLDGKDGMGGGAGGWENARQFTTYYEALQSFDDRAIQQKLTMPRLNWVGAEDDIAINGKSLTHLGNTIINNRKDLEAAGWDVKVLPGLNHGTAGMANVAAPLIRQWLDEQFD